MTDVKLGRLGRYLGFRMRRVHDLQSRDFNLLTRKYRLRQGMFSALELIASNSDMPQSVLGNEIGMDKSAVVSLVDDLEARKWVRRVRSQTDRRRYQLSITPSGRKILDELCDRLESVEAIALEALDKSEHETVRLALDKIYQAYRMPSPRKRRMIT